MSTPPTTPPATPPRALSSGYLSVRTDKVINSWKKPLFFAFVESSVALDRLELVFKKGVKEVAETKVQKEAAATEDVVAAPAEKSAYEAANERLFRTLATAAASGSGILAAYKSNGEEDLKQPVMLINLRDIMDVTLCPKYSKKNRYAFTIHTQGEKIVLAAKVEKELEQWVKTLQRRYRRASEDEVEVTGEYRSVYEMLAAKKAFKKDVQAEEAAAEVTPEIEIVVAEASTVAEEASADAVEETVQEVEVAAGEASAVTEEPTTVVAEEVNSEAEVAVEEAAAAPEATSAAVEEQEVDATPAEETAAAEAADVVDAVPEEAADVVEVAPEESAAAADSQATADASTETPEPAKEVPAVAAKPKSTLMASIASLLKKKQPADKAADKAVPQDIDDHADEAPAVSATQADVEVSEIEVITPADEPAAPVESDVEVAAEPAASSQEEAAAAAAPKPSPAPSKKGILRFFGRKAAPKAPEVAAEDPVATPVEAEAVSEEQAAEVEVSKPAEEAPVVEEEVPEENAANVEEVAVAVEASPADAQPKEAKATSLLRSLSRMLKKRSPAAPVANEGVAEVATDSAVETEAGAEDATVSAAETVVQETVETAAEEPAAEEPAAEEPAAEEPAAEEPAAEEPAAEEPAAEEATTEEPAAEDAAGEAAAEEVAAEESAVEEATAAEESASEEAVAEAAGQAVSPKPAGRSLVRSFSKIVKKVVAK